MDFDKLYEQSGFVLLYLTVALVGAAVVTGLLVYFFKR